MLPYLNYLILLIIIILTAGLFLLLQRRNNVTLTDPDFITPVILNMLDDAIIVLNASNSIGFINESAINLLNSPQKDIIGKNISEFFLDINSKPITELSEIILKTQDGKMIPVKISPLKILDEKNKPEGYGLILKKSEKKNEYKTLLEEKIKEFDNKNNLIKEMMQNLEKEKQNMEQEILESTRNLREEHARLYSSINNLNFGFIMTDKEKNIIMMNKKIKNLVLLPLSETNVQLSDIQNTVKGKVNLLDCIGETLKTGNKFSYQDMPVNDKFTNIFISPIIVNRNNNSEIIGSVILFEDKTEERLIKRSKENFFIIASHELRTPLTGIKGYISLIKQLYFDNIKNEELKRIINDIDTSSSRLINIVNDFLNTSKPGADNIKIRTQQCDLIPIINSCIKETSSLCLEKKLYLNFINPSFPTALVLGDKDKIKEIIINLISNGIKYSEQGGITANLEKTQDERYKVYIRDTGKGITEENKKHLFSKFQQIDPNKRGNIISSGLGLYISKILAEKMNGSLLLENTVDGKGSTFSFSLPVYKDNIAIPNISKVN